MVNLFEPLLLTFLKKTSPSAETKKDLTNLQTKFSEIHSSVKIKTIENHLTGTIEIYPPNFPGIKKSFFSEDKARHWMEILQQKNPEGKDLKLHWNFLFPEIPWSNERIYFNDEKNKSKFYGTLSKEKDTFLLCVLFDSIRTGKIWIYLEYHPHPKKSGSVFFRTEKESIKRMIEKDKFTLMKELEVLGKIRISVETSNDSLVKALDTKLGILV
jgi:hypothetical protein